MHTHKTKDAIAASEAVSKEWIKEMQEVEEECNADSPASTVTKREDIAIKILVALLSAPGVLQESAEELPSIMTAAINISDHFLMELERDNESS